MNEGRPRAQFRGRLPAILVELVHAGRRWRTPRLHSYAPRPLLELPEHVPERASVPAIDAHTHLGRWLHPAGAWMEGDVGRLLEEMDATNVAAVVNLDGRWGRELEENLDRYDRAHPGRFHTFCHLDWRLLDERDGPDLLVESLRRSAAAGARGLKVWKDLGLAVRSAGRHVLVDDPMLDAVWQSAAEAGMPVVVHTADPKAFFLPADRRNERLEEMLLHPKSTRHAGGLALRERLIDSFEHMVASHPATTFIAAHACCPENLARVGTMLHRYPNLSIDVGAVASELGRQPRASRELVLAHSDRVLFGTDVFPWRRATRQVYFRLLETADEAFAHSPGLSPSCRWQIYGLDLPAWVLEKIYRDNAVGVLGIAPMREPAAPGRRVEESRR